MIEYTKEDVIMFDDDKRLKDALGKECYFSDYPNYIITQINEDYCSLSKLIETKTDDRYPFVDTEGRSYKCIVIKKEEPKEYVPFESVEEFVKACLEHNKNHYLAGTGIWIKQTINNEYDEYYMLTIDCLDMNNNTVHSKYSHWSLEEVLKLCKFLDDTPCGKLREE